MVASPNYERLKVFMEAARANKGLDAWDGDHDKALKGFDDAVDRLRAYRESHGFTGATGKAMDHWVDASITRIEKYREGYERGYHTYTRGRNVMATALSEAEKLSPDLLDANTAAMRDDLLVSVPSSEPGTGIRFMGKLYTTGAAYVAAVEEQANEQREAAAKRIIDMVNNRTSTISGIMKGQITDKPGDPDTGLKEFEQQEKDKNPGGGGGGTSGGGTRGGGGAGGAGGGDWGYGKGDDFGRAADRSPSSPNYPGGFDQPWWSEADAAAARNRIISSGAVPTQEPAYGEAGSRTNPITDPQDLMGRDLLHTRVNGTAYRNGVVGGHTPAPPADMELRLARQLADKRIFPAIDVDASGTRREDLLLGRDELNIIWKLRRALSGLDDQAALETLAVIAYRQPVSRSRVSAIRGVAVDGVVRTLQARGLVEEAGTQPNGAVLYRTTEDFLELVGLDSLEDLPPLAPYLPGAGSLDELDAELDG